MTETSEQEPAARGRFRRLAKITLPVWWPLPVCALLGTACGASYGLLKAPEYASTSYVVAVAAKGSDPAAALGFAQAYGRIATSDSTLAYARVAAGVPTSELRERVETETSPDSPMIAITGTSTDPDQAADIANAVADAVFVSSNQVSKNTGVSLTLFSQAISPDESVSPSLPVAAAVGGCAGGLLGGLALLVGPRRRAAVPTVGVPAPAHHAEPAGERELV
ncbi:lipopolysaccharide biosynthesis protein [Streptomyces sp. Tu 2975]|uniref:lipopolysaccharide biosynthesis protein n=1 Tax=Streptomyces sp. Tu 2975 TaxID=2676871 RepID=UPI0013593400|nr:lipopolysaccharide biosynthesis protein [Streptomyces sp. Tu 2975]QIP84912.1 lipopolysaccharide biosynthesis protein [Streptomyces sp. Tu 2975]